MATKAEEELEALTRVLAKLGGISYAEDLKDSADILSSYRAQAEKIIAEGFRLVDTDDWEYASADMRGSVMRTMDAAAYMGPTIEMRRRKAGAWEPRPGAQPLNQ